MSKPSTVTLRIPKELKSRLEIAAQQQGVSLNQFALYILSGEVTRLEVTDEQSWRELDLKYKTPETEEQVLTKARQVLTRARNQKSPDWDQLP